MGFGLVPNWWSWITISNRVTAVR